MNPFRIIATLVLCLASLAPGAVPVKTYTFVYITTGPATDIEQSEQQTAFAGHFSNMKRMAEEGDLLIAGPFGKSESFDDLRGLWVFNTDSTAKALELAATDPPGKLGIFVFEAVQLITDDALLELPRLEREDEARRLADPDVLGQDEATSSQPHPSARPTNPPEPPACSCSQPSPLTQTPASPTTNAC